MIVRCVWWVHAIGGVAGLEVAIHTKWNVATSENFGRLAHSNVRRLKKYGDDTLSLVKKYEQDEPWDNKVHVVDLFVYTDPTEQPTPVQEMLEHAVSTAIQAFSDGHSGSFESEWNLHHRFKNENHQSIYWYFYLIGNDYEIILVDR